MSDNDSDKPDVFHTIVTPNSKPDERPKNLDKIPLQSQYFMSLKAELLTLKDFDMGEINTILHIQIINILFAKNR